MAVQVATWRARATRQPSAVRRGSPGKALRRHGEGLVRAIGWLGPPPLAMLALAPLALGPPATTAPRDLLIGLLVLVALERAVPPIASPQPAGWRALPRAPMAIAALALAVAAVFQPGLGLLAALAAACDGLRARCRLPSVAAGARAVATALRVDAGALLLGGPRGVLLPATIGALVLVATLARARSPGGPGRRGEPIARAAGRLDLLLLAAIALVLALGAALLTEQSVLGPAPSPWAVLAVPFLAAAVLATPGILEPRPASGRVPGRDVLAASAAAGWLASLALACRLGAPV